MQRREINKYINNWLSSLYFTNPRISYSFLHIPSHRHGVYTTVNLTHYVLSFLQIFILQTHTVSEAGAAIIGQFPTSINPLQTKRRPLYLKTQSVPSCKHFSSRLQKPISLCCKWHKSLFILR